MKFKAKRKDLDSLSLAGGQLRIYARGDTSGDIYEIASDPVVGGVLTWRAPLSLTGCLPLAVDPSCEIAATLGLDDTPRVFFRDGGANSAELYCGLGESSPTQLRSGPGTGQMTACRASGGALHAACVEGVVFEWTGSDWAATASYPASSVEAMCLGVDERLVQLCRPATGAALLVNGEALELPNEPQLLGLGRARGCPLPMVLGQVDSSFVLFELSVDNGLVIASASTVLDPSVIEVDEESVVTTANNTYLLAKVLVDELATWQLRELGGAVIRDGLVGPEPGAISAVTLGGVDHLVHVDAAGQLWHITPPALPGGAWVCAEILSPTQISMAS